MKEKEELLIENIYKFEEELKHPKGTPLKYENYEKYQLPATHMGQWVFKFENDYGVSVIKHPGSYGYEEDLFEIAVLYFDDEKHWHITYNTEITDNVIGFLSNDKVLEYMEKIKNLD